MWTARVGAGGTRALCNCRFGRVNPTTGSARPPDPEDGLAGSAGVGGRPQLLAWAGAGDLGWGLRVEALTHPPVGGEGSASCGSQRRVCGPEAGFWALRHGGRVHAALPWPWGRRSGWWAASTHGLPQSRQAGPGFLQGLVLTWLGRGCGDPPAVPLSEGHPSGCCPRQRLAGDSCWSCALLPDAWLCGEPAASWPRLT